MNVPLKTVIKRTCNSCMNKDCFLFGPVLATILPFCLEMMLNKINGRLYFVFEKHYNLQIESANDKN